MLFPFPASGGYSQANKLFFFKFTFLVLVILPCEVGRAKLRVREGLRQGVEGPRVDVTHAVVVRQVVSELPVRAALPVGPSEVQVVLRVVQHLTQ